MHYWGDDFDWEGFSDAIDFFKESYKELTGNHPICKEKYGTLRLEMIDIWVKNPEDERNLKLTLMATACKYPRFSKELLDDYLFGELPQELLERID